MKTFSTLPLPKKITELYLSALFLLLPLYYHNAYFDITEAKLGAFMVLCGLYVLLMPLSELKDTGEQGISSPALWFLGYALISILSCLVFVGRASLLPADNRYQGVVVLGLYGLSFLFISRHGSFGHLPRLCALCAFALVSLLAVLQSFGIDILGLWEGVRATDRGRYLSTVGNVNFLGAYLSLLLPLCAGLYCKGEGKAFYLLPCFALGCCALLCGSDSGILGVGGGLLFLWGSTMKNAQEAKAYGMVLCLLGLSVFLYGQGLKAFGTMGLSKAGEILSSPFVALPLSVLGAWMYFGGRSFARPWLFPALISAGGALGLVLCNLFPAIVPGSLRPYVVFSPGWGSDRGRIWMHAMDLFRSFAPLKKLIGGGSGVLARYDRVRRLFPDAVVDTAHNEYLHTLLTAGIGGLMCYALALLGTIKQGIKNHSALSAAVVGCALQATVNIAQCNTTPLFLALMAVLSA